VELFSIEMDHESFGLALGARSQVDCEFEARGLDKLGQVHEHKSEDVPYTNAYGDEAAPAKEKALEPFEVDGWRAHRDDLGNSHRSNRDGTYTVTFTRTVDPTPNEHSEDCCARHGCAHGLRFSYGKDCCPVMAHSQPQNRRCGELDPCQKEKNDDD